MEKPKKALIERLKEIQKDSNMLNIKIKHTLESIEKNKFKISLLNDEIKLRTKVLNSLIQKNRVHKNRLIELETEEKFIRGIIK